MSARYAPLVLAFLIFLCAKTNAFNVYHLGGTDGHPWQTALSYEPGDYRVLNPDGTISQRLPLSAPSAHPTWEDTLGERIDSVGGQWLRPFFLPDTLNLAQDGIRERYRNDFFVDGNLFTSGPSYEVSAQTGLMRPAVDGDPQTASFYTASASSDPTVRRGIYIQNNVVDLGINYPVNRIRFFPRLGTSNPKIDAILASMAPPKLRKEDLLEEDFSANFMPWFELAAANNDQNLVSSSGARLREIIPGIPNAKSDSRFTVLFADRENLDVVMDFRFPTQQLRWIAYRVLDPIRNYEIAEFQVFGSGYIQRAIYTTAVLDFGQPMAWGNIRWKGTRDPQAQLLIRTRTGHDDEPLLYWQKTSIPGEYKQVTRKGIRHHSQTRTTPDPRRTKLEFLVGTLRLAGWLGRYDLGGVCLAGWHAHSVAGAGALPATATAVSFYPDSCGQSARVGNPVFNLRRPCAPSARSGRWTCPARTAPPLPTASCPPLIGTPRDLIDWRFSR